MAEGKTGISKAQTLEKMGEFWDEHDFTEFDTDAPDVVFDLNPNFRTASEGRNKK